MEATVRGLPIAVVIPCFRVKDAILGVIAAVGPDTAAIYVVDDACPERTGDHVRRNCGDPRVRVLTHEKNLGVGGAVMTGYRAAVGDGAGIVVKLDGDGQMDPARIPDLVAPIAEGLADYTKGNRFFRLEDLRGMPATRVLGNAVLSFLSKLSSGYWNVFDPTNGYTAVHAAVLRLIPLEKVSRDYFFESDLLFRLNTVGAAILDVPMESRYAGESSGLRIPRIIPRFLLQHTRNTLKRIFYNYFLRDFSIASLELLFGVALLTGGALFGGWRWQLSYSRGPAATSGTIMLAALPVLVGIQLLLAFLSYDMSRVPHLALHPRLRQLAGGIPPGPGRTP